MKLRTFTYINLNIIILFETFHRVGSGSWKTDGVAMMSQELSADNTTMTVTCNATHLTSFAVLVDLSGTLNSGVSATRIRFLTICRKISMLEQSNGHGECRAVLVL